MKGLKMFRKVLTLAGLGAGAVAMLAGFSFPGGTTTYVPHRADSGNYGNWAYDYLNRSFQISQGTAVPAADCGATATTCYSFTASIWDRGTFSTIPGGPTPNASGVSLLGHIDGTITGGGQYAFDASTQPDLSLVPGLYPGSSVDLTGDWYALAFPSGTLFNGGVTEAQALQGEATATISPWSWTYTAQCVHYRTVSQTIWVYRYRHWYPIQVRRTVRTVQNEKWVDASDADYGNITGCLK
jgi:hypothetical protein